MEWPYHDNGGLENSGLDCEGHCLDIVSEWQIWNSCFQTIVQS